MSRLEMSYDKVTMTRKLYNLRQQANPCHREVNTYHWQLHDNRRYFNEMFGEIFPEVGDLTPDGVCACVCLCMSLNSHQRLRSYGALYMA